MRFNSKLKELLTLALIIGIIAYIPVYMGADVTDMVTQVSVALISSILLVVVLIYKKRIDIRRD
jgi:ABC-type Mn2+/Zn2+ transport system permease subunit